MIDASTTPKVLLVEDDSVFRMLVKRLVGEDFLIAEASSLEAARQFLANDRFSCLLLDYRLPDGTGLHLLPEAILLDLPVVMMTAMGHEQLAVDAIKQGCQDYLIKDDLTRASLGRSLLNAMRYVQADRLAMRHRHAFQQIIQATTSKCHATTAALRESFGGNGSHADDKETLLQHLDHLMDGLTAYSRLTSISWSPESIALGEVAQEVLADLRPVLSSFGIEVQQEHLPSLNSDRAAIKVILRNMLVCAATEVSASGQSEISLNARKSNDEYHLRLVFSCDPARSASIFKCLSQPSLSSRNGDGEMRLDVTRLLVEQLNGQLWAKVSDDKTELTIGFSMRNQSDGLASRGNLATSLNGKKPKVT